MPVISVHVSERMYRRFKRKAEELGLSIPGLLRRAGDSWVQLDDIEQKEQRYEHIRSAAKKLKGRKSVRKAT